MTKNFEDLRSMIGDVAELMKKWRNEGRHVSLVTLPADKVMEIATRFGVNQLAVGIKVSQKPAMAAATSLGAQPSETGRSASGTEEGAVVAMMVVPTEPEADGA